LKLKRIGEPGPRQISVAITSAGEQLQQQIKASPRAPFRLSAVASVDYGGAHGEYH
jgi:hypothetical protein